MSEIKNILVTGASGQVGLSFGRIKKISNSNYIFVDKNQLDICDTNAVQQILRQHKINALVNCAAYTNVNQAMIEKPLAMAINATAPGNLASLCQQMDIRFFHISTDYVFSGDKATAYTETDTCAPINTYGFSKLAGEQLVTQNNTNAVIIRTSWVFSRFGKNFVKTMLDLAKTKPELQLINDQIGGPSWANHIANVIDKLIYLPNALVPGGIYNFSGYPWLSWHDFAKEIFYTAYEYGYINKIPKLVAINSQDWPSPEPRPLNSRLDSSKLIKLFYDANLELKRLNQERWFKSINMPFDRDWRLGLQDILN